MKTVVVNTDDIKRKWYVVDANNKIVGRLASHLATVLTGKNKPAFSPNQDHGDNIIVINADGVRLTGKKADTKTYFHHTGYAGGKKERPFKKQMALDSRQVILHAVRGMVPKTKLGRAVIKKLHVYKTGEHPHIAQQPEVLSL
ncbi:MAG TPA: 50S ribosomal protein L13 [Chitinivibrionales bacterium]|jgi:large subunit ribosomal protein L13